MGVSESEDEPLGEDPVVDEQDLMADDDDEDGSVEDTDEEEEDVAAYEDDGFVVDEEEEEESDNSTESKSKKTKRKGKKRKPKDLHLDEDDYNLLEENNAGRHRAKGGRRLIKGDAEEVGRLDLPRTRETHRFAELEDFQDDDEVMEFESEDEEDERMRSFDQMEDQMEIDDFIVEDEMADERPRPRSRRHREKANSAAYQEALREVDEIFGEAFGLVAKYEEAQRKRREEADPRSSLDALYQDADGSGSHHQASQRASVATALDDYDPEALAMHCLLPRDDTIRRTDLPERFQERMGAGPKEFEYHQAAEWIYDCLLGSNQNTPEAEILENGQLEVDGPSAEENYCSKSSEALCVGHRVVRSIRVSDQKEQWKHDAKAQIEIRRMIENVLKHIYEDQEEIPYIATYRKKSCGELLCLAADEVPNWTTQEEYNVHKDEGLHFPPPGAVQAKNIKMKRWQVLWTVFELSLKWRRLRLRVEKRVDAFHESESLHSTEPEVLYAIQTCIDQMRDAITPEDVDVANRRFRLFMAALGKKPPPNDMGSSSDVQRYCAYSDRDYRTIVEGMGTRPFLDIEIGKNNQADTSAMPLCCRVDLDDVVADIMQKNKGIVGVDAVLVGAQHIAAMDLACHPYIRSTAQRLFEVYATVTTIPTDLGEKVLDPFHMYGTIKRLVDKPISSFKGDMFLRVIGAFRGGYIKYAVEIKEDVLKTKILPVLMAEALTGDLRPLCEGWENFRKDVIEHLAKSHLFPAFEKATVQKLSERARSCVLNGMAENLWKFVIQGPFKPSIDENNYEEQESMVRVCACCWGQGGKGQPSTVLVMLDNFGELKDTIELKQFSGFFEPPASQDPFFEPPDVLKDERKKEDAQRIREFLMEHKPNVVVVGGAHMICRKLVEDLEVIRDHFLTEHSRFMVSIQGHMEILLLSEMLPATWENSPAAMTEFPDHTAHVRRAVALGRCLIDPLSVMASLRDHFNTILSVGLSDLQELIIKEERLARIDQVMVTAMNQLGGELNLMSNIQWRFHALQFIAGLGRRKAQGLLRYMNCNSNRIESRHHLAESGQIGSTVLKNCIGFLLIMDSELPGMSNMEFDPLDETRIHLDHYSRAREMAMLAVGARDPDAALVELSEKPYVIRSLDLDWFNKEGIEQGRDDVLSILIDVSMELFVPCTDRRPPFSKPDELEVFYILLNEKAETMKPGKLVEAVVQSVDEHELQCSLIPSQLKGTIKREQFSGSEDVQQIDLKSRVRRGDILSARLVGIEYKNFLVELSCRSVDLKNDERWEQEYCTDPYYRIKTAAEREQELLSRTSRQEKRFAARRIDHPLFKNISEAECVDLLSRSPPGYTVLRPSQEDPHLIIVSFNAFSGKHGDIYLHRRLKEGPKGTVRGTQMKLGLPLTMMLTSTRCMTFDDLDEVVPCFVDPYIDRVKALKMHRKFKDGYTQDVDNAVNEDKRRAGPKTAAYCLGVDYAQPGCYYIASRLNINVCREYFTIVPDGYSFRKRIFRNLESMIGEFKAHPRPVQAQPPPPLPPIGEASPPPAAGSSFPETSHAPPPETSHAPPPRANSESSDDDMHF